MNFQSYRKARLAPNNTCLPKPGAFLGLLFPLSADVVNYLQNMTKCDLGGKLLVDAACFSPNLIKPFRKELWQENKYSIELKKNS